MHVIIEVYFFRALSNDLFHGSLHRKCIFKLSKILVLSLIVSILLVFLLLRYVLLGKEFKIHLNWRKLAEVFIVLFVFQERVFGSVRKLLTKIYTLQLLGSMASFFPLIILWFIAFFSANCLLQ
jgi:hypothetical protein